jgi:hypothetical protein
MIRRSNEVVQSQDCGKVKPGSSRAGEGNSSQHPHILLADNHPMTGDALANWTRSPILPCEVYGEVPLEFQWQGAFP